MRAEIVAVGTELLLGQIANTNAQRISEALARAGVDVYFHTTVGDNLLRMTGVISTALGRSDAVIVTGGLGPTPDDITREAVAAAAGRALARDECLVDAIRGVFERLGRRSMPEANLRQADLPEGASPIEPEGTAPGFVLRHGGTTLFALPGVPWEMQAMLDKTVLPQLRAASGGAPIVSSEVLVVGVGESHVDETISDIVDAQTNPTIAFLAGGGRVRVRITAKAATEAEAAALIEPVEESVRARLGVNAVGRGHGSVAAEVGELLRQQGATLAVAESLTGGGIGAEVTRLAGASDFFLGSLVAYSDRAKTAVAGIDPALIEEHGTVSEEVAAALARAAAERFGADLGISATGVAGPGDHEGKPPGTVFVGAWLRGRSEVRKPRAYGDRGHIREIAGTWALDLGRRLLLRR
ncbi:MAG: competence/damage-inducible protein A [Actinomycetota bacterium]|nr:competence/damage-inducible protein A [Actinomycetota bacterium]